MKKILIIRFSSIGDIVLTSPVIRAVRNKYPESHISMLVKEEFAPLIADCPYLNEVIILKTNEPIKDLANKLKENKYDVIIDIHRNLRSIYLDYTLSVEKRLIYKKNILKRWLLLNLHLKLLDENTSVINSYFNALKPLNIENDNKGLEIWISKRDEEIAEEFQKKYAGKDILMIGLAPFAHWETKCWPMDHYKKLVNDLSKKIECRFIIFGGPGDIEKLGSTFEDLKNKPIIAINELGLMAQAALIKKCQYFIGNDTGLMHIADAAGIPLITFFGPTVKEFGFAPVGKNSVVLSRDLKCRPCSLHGSNSCPKGTLECLKAIKPEDVTDIIIKKLWK
ncbi:MAG: glycosyltransferase family 9 protein [bacterium]|nr:glycosyltransferase family 9 protein [bacterium]